MTTRSYKCRAAKRACSSRGANDKPSSSLTDEILEHAKAVSVQPNWLFWLIASSTHSGLIAAGSKHTTSPLTHPLSNSSLGRTSSSSTRGPSPVRASSC